MTAPTAGVANRTPRVTRRRVATRAAPQPRTEVIVLAVPCSVDDLVACLGALRETGQEMRIAATDRRRMRFAGWALDLIERRLVAPGGGVVPLPGIEFMLLRAFVANPRRVLSRADLAEFTQRGGKPFRSPRTVDAYVSRLRVRLGRSGGAPLISTVRGTGYVFEVDVVRT